MSMSYENVCWKCRREFDAWCRQKLCNDCMEVVKVKDLPPNKVVKITDTGGYGVGYMFAKDLEPVGDLNYVVNDSDFRLILEYAEIKALENRLGHKIEIKQ